MLWAFMLLANAEPQPVSAALEESRRVVRVVDATAYIYVEPSFDSAILRRPFVGELLAVDRELVAPDGSRWLRTHLGDTEVGYAPAHLVGRPTDVPSEAWEPPKVIRNERPLAMGVRVLGQTFGGSLSARFQAFTRLGLTFDAGSVIDKREMQGTALSAGLNTFLVLWNFSPMVEVGIARLSYHAGNSTLRISNVYFLVGVEWMFDWGGFVNVFATYMRSLDVEVAYVYATARSEELAIAKYGRLEPDASGDFQGLTPGLTLGYAF